MDDKLRLELYFKFFIAGGSVERKSLYDEEAVEGWLFTIDAFGERREFTCIGLWDEVPEMPEDLIEYIIKYNHVFP